MVYKVFLDVNLILDFVLKRQQYDLSKTYSSPNLSTGLATSLGDK